MTVDQLLEPGTLLVALGALNVTALWIWLKAHRVRLVVKRPATFAGAVTKPAPPVQPTPEAESAPAAGPGETGAASGEERLVQDLKRWLARMKPPTTPRPASTLRRSSGAGLTA